MNGVDIVGVLLGAVAGVAHIADHIPGSYHAALLQIKGIGKILPQMGVIIIALLIKAADADPPASVPVPAKSLHIAGFNADDRCANMNVILYQSNYRGEHAF